MIDSLSFLTLLSNIEWLLRQGPWLTVSPRWPPLRPALRSEVVSLSLLSSSLWSTSNFLCINFFLDKEISHSIHPAEVFFKKFSMLIQCIYILCKYIEGSLDQANFTTFSKYTPWRHLFLMSEAVSYEDVGVIVALRLLII